MRRDTGLKIHATESDKLALHAVSWLSTYPVVYDFEVQPATPSNNIVKELHWMKYRTLRQMWRVKVLQHGLEGRKPEKPLARAALVIDRGCAGSLDWDNAYGGLKPLLDCLVAPSKRNPDGLGLVLDDNPKAMPVPPLVIQHKAQKGQSWTRVRIFDLMV